MITYEQDIVGDSGDDALTVTIDKHGLSWSDSGRLIHLTFEQYRAIAELVRKYEAMQEIANAQR